MYEVIYVIDGVQKKMMVNAGDAISAQKLFTNMYSGFGIQIIDIRRV